jgi:hypothetical protein
MKGLVLTYLLAYGGAILALFNPFVGVCVYWFFDIVRPQYMFAWAGADGSYSQVIALATIVGWAAKGFGDWSFKRSRIIIAFFVASTLWTVLSAAGASNQEVATAYLEPLFKRAIMFTIAVTTVTTAARLRTAAWVIVGGAGYVSLELNLAYLGGFNHARQLGYGGMDNNSLAISLVTCLGVALIMALYSPRLWQKAAALGSAAAIAHTVLLTFSRGGMLGMIVAGAAAFVILPKRPKYLAALGGTVILSLTFAGPEVRERFASSFSEGSERDWSAQSRWTCGATASRSCKPIRCSVSAPGTFHWLPRSSDGTPARKRIRSGCRWAPRQAFRDCCSCWASMCRPCCRCCGWRDHPTAIRG